MKKKIPDLKKSGNKPAEVQKTLTSANFIEGAFQTLNRSNIDVFNTTNRIIEEAPDMNTEQRVKALWDNCEKLREQTVETAYTILKVAVCLGLACTAYKNPELFKGIQRSLKKAA